MRWFQEAACEYLLGGVWTLGWAVAYEPELMDAAKRIMDKTRIPMPVDVVVADAFSETANIRTVPVGDVADAEMILDVGPETVVALSEEIERAKTIIWNVRLASSRCRLSPREPKRWQRLSRLLTRFLLLAAVTHLLPSSNLA